MLDKNSGDFERIVLQPKTILKTEHKKYLDAILSNYPPEKGYEITVLTCISVDDEKDRVMYGVQRNKIFGIDVINKKNL